MPGDTSDHQLICFVGAPGTGKSTLTQALNVNLKMQGRDCEFCPEYARSYMRRSGRMLHPLEQFIIFAGWAQREDEVLVHEYVVADSGSFLAPVWYEYERSHHPRGSDVEELKLEWGLHEMRRLGRERLHRINHMFFVPPGLFDSGKDPTREYVAEQQLLSRKILAHLEDNGADYHQVEAVELEERVQEVLRVLDERGALVTKDA